MYCRKAYQQHSARLVVMRRKNGHNRPYVMESPYSSTIAVPVMHPAQVRWKLDQSPYIHQGLTFGTLLYRWDGRETNVQGLPIYREL